MLSKALRCSLLLMLAAIGPLRAQNPGTGLYTFGSFDARGLDTVNLGNLNTHFAIPIVSKPGRGLPFNYTVVYDGLIWSSTTSSGTGYWQPDPTFGFHNQLYGAIVGYMTYQTRIVSCPRPPGRSGSNPPGVETFNYTYHDPYGGSHVFNYNSGYNCVLSDTEVDPSGDGSTADGSGYRYQGGSVYAKDGVQIHPNWVNSGPGGSITDPNGNTITNNQDGSFTDTLGVKELTIAGGATSASPILLTYPVANQTNGATTATATVSYKTYSVQTNFGCSGVAEYGPVSADLVDHITLADGVTTYTFAYEATPGASGAVTGRLGAITLPTGGVVGYQYSGGCGNGINTDGTPATMTRTLTAGSTTYPAKTYVRDISQTPVSTTTVTDEMGNEVDYTFISSSSGLTYETSRSLWQGAASSTKQLENRTTAYNSQPASTQITGAITLTTVVDSFNGLKPVQLITGYDAAGNPTSNSVRDPSNSNAALLNTLNYYNAYEELNATSTIDPTNSNATVSCASYGYDENTPTATSGIPQHQSLGNTVRGNRTSWSVCASSSTSLSGTTSYYDTGAVQSTSSSAGTTQYTLDSTQTFTTQTTLPTPASGVTLATSAGFEPNSGIQTSATGFNSGQTFTFAQYDSLLRPIQVTNPDNGGSTFSYSPAQVGVVTRMNNSQSADQETFLDAFGRTQRVAVRSDLPGQTSPSWYLTDYCYFPTGQLQYRSTPYTSTTSNPSGNACATGTATAYTYDALGRTQTVSHPDGSSVALVYNGRAVQSTAAGIARITQYNLLGQIASVCEISSNSSMPNSGAPVPCGADIAGTGFVTSYAYNLSTGTTTVTQGAQTRVFQVDYLGRPVYTSEPESGVTTYSYSYNSTGLQVTRTRPQANVPAVPAPSPVPTTNTVTQYDNLGRVVSISYSDSSTANKYFLYDMPYSGDVIRNKGAVIGQMSNAYSLAPNGSLIFAREMVYDIMGRVTETKDCLSSWCGSAANDVYRLYGYDLASNLSTEQYATVGNGGSLATLTYGYNLAGQLTSLTGGQNNGSLAPGIYSASAMVPSGPTLAQLGNGMYTPYAYDASGHLSGAAVCSQAVPGACTVPVAYAYGIVSQGQRVLQSSDNLVGSSNYGYDEFGRLQTVNTQYPGVNPSLSFTYDRYGNRTDQNVTAGTGLPFHASYNTANNQLVWPTSAQFQYDIAGNVINDGSHGYTYDAENNLVSVDNGSTALYRYDALNERMEAVTPQSDERYGFDLSGRRATSWTTATGALDTAQYYAGTRVAYWSATDGGLHFEHQDWLGTERARTNASGALEARFTSQPFGDNLAQVSGTSDTNPGHFATLDQDSSASTGLSHAMFREYHASSGRWLSADSYLGSYTQTNPQSLNRYAYSLNNPIRFIDPSGRSCIFIESVDEDGTYEETLADDGDGEGCEAAGVASAADGGGVSGEVVNVNADDDPDPGTLNLNVNPFYVFGNALSGLGALAKVAMCTLGAPIVSAARFENGVVGAGVGGSAGLGAIVGFAGGGSAQLVADPQGHVGIAFSGSYNLGLGVLGFGGLAGVQASVSTARQVTTGTSGFLDAGISGGAAPAIGVDVSKSDDGDYTGTLTVGPGFGGKGAAFMVGSTWTPYVVACP